MTASPFPAGYKDPAERRALLKALTAQQMELGADIQNRYKPFRLTDIQQAYWVGRDAAFPLGGVGIHGYFEIECRDLDIARLEQALNETICRHDMMRVIVLPDGTARIIAHPPYYKIATEDLADLSKSARATRLAMLREQMSHHVFDVQRWPLFNVRAVRLDRCTTLLLHSEDAIHIDLASSELVMNDWIRLYRGERLSPSPALSFRDYAVALHRRGRTVLPTFNPADDPDQMGQCPDTPDLPRVIDDQQVAMVFNRRKIVLDTDDLTALKRAVRQRGLTLSDGVLGAYADVICGWSRGGKCLLNVTLQARPPIHPDIGRIAGDFTSFTLVEIDPDGALTFTDRARAHRDRLWENLDDGQPTGVDLLRRLAKARGSSAPAYVPYVYTSALGTSGYRRIEELGKIVYEVTQTPQVLIDQQVLEASGTMVLSWDSVDGAFPPGMIDTMFGTLETLLRSLATSPEAWDRRGRLPLPPAQQAARERMNDTAGAFPDVRLEELFAAQAGARGDAVAVIDDRGQLTYADLDRQSDGLAAAIISEGLGQGPIALALRKGRDQIVAILAVLKAGAAYMPVDLTSPAARTQRTFAAAACTAAIVDAERPFGALPTGVRTIDVSAAPPDHAPAPPATAGSPQDTAYILFTSGSTGDPKAVPVSHASVVNRMDDVVTRFGLGPDDRGFALTKLHHDLSVFDVFGLIAAAGGSIVIPPEPTAGPGDPQAWRNLIARHDVTVWNSVPGLMEMLLAAGGRALPRLRLALLSGDWVPKAIAGAIRSIAPQASVVSLGGPTETTVWDICHPIDAEHEDWPSVPYGRPMRGARYDVLRDDLSQCPDWVAGELCLSGVGLTQGYLNPTPEDAARFIVHPETGVRMFRSGDIGRVRPGGEIEFLGRKDRQIKIGGQRIELGEVEAAMREHPGAARAVAFVAKTISGEDMLAAGYTPDRAPAEGTIDIVVEPADGPPRDGERRSALALSRRSLDVGELTRLLGYFRPGADGADCTRRLHPSVGGRYAVSLLVHVGEGRVTGVRSGLHRFDAAAGRLHFIGGPTTIDAAAHAPRNAGLAQDAAITLLLVAPETAPATSDYGEGWRDLCLIEAGYIGQSAMEAAAAVGLGVCPIGGLDVAGLPLPAGEDLLHVLVVGGIPGQPGRPAATPSAETAEQDMRRHLTERLPPHMVPKRLMRLETMPVTSTGKPDVARLCAILPTLDEATAVAADQPAPAPPPHAAATVTQAVSDVLGFAPPIDRPLQEAGATSIDVVRIHALLADAGYRLTVTDLFRFPSIAMLSAFLSGDGYSPDAARADGAHRADARRAAIARQRERRGD